MAIVYFDRPKGKRDPNRDANALLLAQVQHLREAEKGLPPEYHSGIFSQAIRTEGEVAEYVKLVTDAIHRAHADAVKGRAMKARALQVRKPVRVGDIAAQIDEAAERKQGVRKKKSAVKKAAKKKSGKKK